MKVTTFVFGFCSIFVLRLDQHTAHAASKKRPRADNANGNGNANGGDNGDERHNVAVYVYLEFGDEPLTVRVHSNSRVDGVGIEEQLRTEHGEIVHCEKCSRKDVQYVKIKPNSALLRGRQIGDKRLYFNYAVEEKDEQGNRVVHNKEKSETIRELRPEKENGKYKDHVIDLIEANCEDGNKRK